LLIVIAAYLLAAILIFILFYALATAPIFLIFVYCECSSCCLFLKNYFVI